MVRIAGHRLRVIVRHVFELAIGAVLMGTMLALAHYVWHWKPGVTIGAAVAIPLAAHGIGALLGTALRGEWLDRPEVSWDQQGLTYRNGTHAEDVHLVWTDYQGHRFTWEYPSRLKIRRGNGPPLKIDLFAFSREDRRLLLAELNGRRGALPNKRLKLTAPC